MCTAVKHIVIVRLNVAENCVIEITGGCNSETTIFVQKCDPWIGLDIEAVIALDLKTQKGTPTVLHLSIVEICF